MLRALWISAPIPLIPAPATLAQTFEPAALAADIPAQPLAQALAAFARQTGIQFVYVSGVVHEQRSHAVSAGLGANEALARMLEGTGLKFEHLTPRSIRILAVMVGPPQESTTKTFAGEELQEVIVTANRREENLQNVPFTIQVLSGETLAKLNATTFDDFVKYLPAVTAHGVGPAQNSIYVRGLGTTDPAIQGSGWGGIFPNVAVYLDDQSAQLPGRNLDVYAADIERIELLEGPQGTLFGAGAEAGVLRYITNKPKLNVTEATVNAGYATTAHGDQSSSLDATLNLPLIADALAVRAVIYDEKRGGYINNLPATFARAPTDLAISTYFGGNVPTNSVVINNFNVAANHINPVTYTGLRVEALYRFNEDWNALLAQSYQNIEADGVFAEMDANSLGEPLPDLSVQLYNPSYDKDKFENTALTLEGRVGDLKLVYAGAYLVRNVEQVQDYTSYARGLYVDYYQCAGPTQSTVQCFTPSSTWRNRERNTHQSQELRVSTPGDWRIRWIGGLFYENYQIQDQVDYLYLTALPYFNPIGPPTGYYTPNGVFVSAPVTSNNPNVRQLGDGFFNDITRGYTQKAAYASVDFDLVPQALTVTAGTRYFRTDTSEVGSDVGSFGCELISNPMVPNPCVNHSNLTNFNAEGLERTYSGFRSRVNLELESHRRSAAVLHLVARLSRGRLQSSPIRSQRPIRRCTRVPDRGKARPISMADGPRRWPSRPITSPITNSAGRRCGWTGASNGTARSIRRTGITRRSVIGAHGVINYGVTINGGNYRVRGIETSGVARVTAGLTIEAGASWNHSELVKQATFRLGERNADQL